MTGDIMLAQQIDVLWPSADYVILAGRNNLCEKCSTATSKGFRCDTCSGRHEGMPRFAHAMSRTNNDIHHLTICNYCYRHIRGR